MVAGHTVTTVGILKAVLKGATVLPVVSGPDTIRRTVRLQVVVSIRTDTIGISRLLQKRREVTHGLLPAVARTMATNPQGGGIMTLKQNTAQRSVWPTRRLR